MLTLRENAIQVKDIQDHTQNKNLFSQNSNFYCYSLDLFLFENHTDLILFGRVAGFRDSELMNGRYIPLGGKTCPQLVCSHTQSCFRASEKHPKLKNTYRLRISQ